MKYKVVVGTKVEVEMEVDKLLEKGWVLQGGIAIQERSTEKQLTVNKITYAQALTFNKF